MRDIERCKCGDFMMKIHKWKGKSRHPILDYRLYCFRCKKMVSGKRRVLRRPP